VELWPLKILSSEKTWFPQDRDRTVLARRRWLIL
jgi:hypothetical protein